MHPTSKDVLSRGCIPRPTGSNANQGHSKVYDVKLAHSALSTSKRTLRSMPCANARPPAARKVTPVQEPALHFDNNFVKSTRAPLTRYDHVQFDRLRLWLSGSCLRTPSVRPALTESAPQSRAPRVDISNHSVVQTPYSLPQTTPRVSLSGGMTSAQIGRWPLDPPYPSHFVSRLTSKDDVMYARVAAHSDGRKPDDPDLIGSPLDGRRRALVR